MSKENFEKQIRKRMEQLDEINKHGIFKELKGTVTDFNYDTCLLYTSPSPRDRG